MAKQPQHVPIVYLPKAGDCYVCDMCGMKLEVTVDCATMQHMVAPSFECCGQPMTKD
jgi:hypothetical protein